MQIKHCFVLSCKWFLLGFLVVNVLISLPIIVIKSQTVTYLLHNYIRVLRVD